MNDPTRSKGGARSKGPARSKEPARSKGPARHRVAILGAGIGREHLRGYLALPERFEVAALCDLDAARARTVLDEAAPGAGIRVATDADALIAEDAIDLVDVCLPPHLHAPLTIRALRAGRHVVCEKPMATSPGEARAMVEAADHAGRRLFPVFQYRYGPGMARLRALMEAGLAGRAYAASLETHWDRAADYYAVPWRGTWAGENGGAVLGHAIHNHDLMTSVLGPVAALGASVATRVNAIEVEDCAAIAFTMASGAVATSSITLGAATNETRLRFVFEHLTAESGRAPYAPAEDEWRFTARGATPGERAGRQARIDAVLAGVGPVRSGFAGFFEAVADALDGPADGGTDGAGDGAHAVSAEDGLASIDLVAAVYAAARSGREVRLPLGDDHPLRGGWRPDPAVDDPAADEPAVDASL